MSNKPVLYLSIRSPPCRAVLLTAAALGLDLELRQINVKAGDNRTPEFLKLNPQHTIPVLDDNGVVVTDSHVICAYLANKYATDESLYPRDTIKRMEVDARLYFDCGHLFPRVRFMLEPVIYDDVDNIPVEKIVYMQKAYDGLEQCLKNHGNYLCGEHLTIADLCCVASISTSSLFAPIDEEKYPKLCSWLERLKELPYYQKSNQEGVDVLEKFIEQRLIENKNAKESAKKA